MQVEDEFAEDEFERLLENAEDNADTDFELEFTGDMRARWDRYGVRMYISDRQLEVLERIANGS